MADLDAPPPATMPSLDQTKPALEQDPSEIKALVMKRNSVESSNDDVPDRVRIRAPEEDPVAG
jgi:hypothetical protein